MNMLNQAQIDALKHEAWKTKKATGRKHHECLDELALARGYKNWSMLMLNNRADKEQADGNQDIQV